MELRPGEPTFEHTKQILLGPNRLRLMAANAIITLEDSTLLNSIRDYMATDEFANDVLDHILPDRASSSQSKNPRNDYHQFYWHGGFLFWRNLLYVPNGPPWLWILQYCHDTPIAGHFGVQKTLELISRQYWWPHLRHFVEEYVRNWDTCCQSKSPRHQSYGLLQPLPIPENPWKSISLDFITDLPVSKGFDAILTVVDRLTKMAHFLPSTKSNTSQDTINLVMRKVFMHDGLPDDIISDRGSLVIHLKNLKHILKLLRISDMLFSGYHPKDYWPNWAYQPDYGAISSLFYQLPTRWFVWFSTLGWFSLTTTQSILL